MRWLSHLLATALGWRFEGIVPDEPKMVVLGAPHTTNWDFFLFLATLHHFGLRVRYLAKRSLFRWPFGWFFRATGGVPVDRRQPGGVVAQVEQAFAEEDRMILVVAPEGTRGKAAHWKSGFVEIAERVGIPVVPAGVDGVGKRVIIGDPVRVGGDRSEVMGRLRAFYEGKSGVRPELATPVVLAEEV